jgi:sn-glycerol 3-phosphate transport system ATP-binding protein
MAEVEFSKVTKRFSGDVVAVKALDLHVDDGEFTILVGPSGCGKTTALRMLAGLDKPTAGELLIDRQVVNSYGPGERDIAMVFQNYALYPHMSVYKNLAYGLRQRKTPKAEVDRRVRQMGEILGITELLGRKPAQLSGGQRQRVAMGRALVREPQVFLLDEPLSNLDAKLRAQVRAELKRLHQRLGITSIYVTHDQVEAMTLGDRICVMNHGELQQVGSPQDVYDHPANAFVAGFIGSPAMNLLPAAVVDGYARLGGHRIAPVPRGHDQVVVGIRPEALDVVSAGSDGMLARVDFHEPLGSHVLVHALIDDALVDDAPVGQALADESLGEGDDPAHAIVVQAPPGLHPSPGDALRLSAAAERIFLFDAATGDVLDQAPAADAGRKGEPR